MRRSRLRLLWFYALRASDFCHRDGAVHFYFLASRSNATLFQAKTVIAGTTTAFLNDYHLMCEDVAVNEDVGVHQMTSLLRLGVLPPREGSAQRPLRFPNTPLAGENTFIIR